MKLFLTFALIALSLIALSIQGPRSLSVQAESKPTYENYDIRADAGSVEKLSTYRGNARSSSIRPDRSRFKIDYNETVGIVETIDPLQGAEHLANSDKGRAQTLENFVLTNRDLFGVRTAAQLVKTA